MNALLLLGFLLNAFASSLAGLGGGTFYLLFLTLFSVNYEVIPFIALLCNISVSGISAGMRLLHGQRERLSFFIWILIPSTISTYAGGQFVFSARDFHLVISSAIFLVLCFMLLTGRATVFYFPARQPINKILILALMSFGIGFLSGIMGIGGGIILGPVLYMLGMSYLDIPLVTAVYIFVNSIVGIVSHMLKYTSNFHGGRTEALAHLGSLIKPYMVLIFVCVSSAVLSKFINNRIKYESVIRNIVLFIMFSLTVYNLARVVIKYYA